MPKIWGKYENRAVEELDGADTLREALRLRKEYRMAFGPGWEIWVGKKYPIPSRQAENQGCQSVSLFGRRGPR